MRGSVGEDGTITLVEEFKEDFPDIDISNHKKTSEYDPSYNCIAYAADDDKHWWWPLRKIYHGKEKEWVDQHRELGKIVYWPEVTEEDVTLESFIEAFGTRGYTTCADGNLEQDFEKIVIYLNEKKEPTHAAKQLEDGKWSSKIGENEDICHTTPDVLNGELYGKPFQYMKRPKTY